MRWGMEVGRGTGGVCEGWSGTDGVSGGVKGTRWGVWRGLGGVCVVI